MPNIQAYDDFVDYFEPTWLNFNLSKWNVHLRVRYRAAACDVTGGVASLNLKLQSCKFFKGNLGPSNPTLQYGHFETYR